MMRRAATLITVAYVLFTAALPARASEPEPAPALAHTAEVVTGFVATSVQLAVYGSCMALGGEDQHCLADADVAARRAAGRGAPLTPAEL